MKKVSRLFTGGGVLLLMLVDAAWVDAKSG